MSLYSYLLEYNRYLNLVGIAVIIGIAYVCSRHKKKINHKLVRNALAMQFVIAFLALKTSGGQYFLQALSNGVGYLYKYASEGINFLFGNLANGAQTPWGVVFAIQILPMIIFFGAFTALLFHLGVVQRIVGGLGIVVRPILGTTGAETLCAISNSFLGQTEAPLLIRNYLKNMTKSELLVVMVSGMGTISGSILAIYASMGAPIKSLLTASVMAIPATIMIAKILLPETEDVEKEDGKVSFEHSSSNVFDAIATGTSDGLQLALNVGAMLLAFIALMAMLNGILGGTCTYLNSYGFNVPCLTLDVVFAKLFYPFAYLLGFTGTDATQVAELLGTKVAINEFLAYYKMVDMHLPARVQELTTYALCGFSNFSCIGIQVGGIGALVPEKRQWLTELGLTAVLGGALSNLLTAMVAGLFI
ncbi:MAG: CNT family concentrative nucleoside transporter [Alteromonas naphthalenivorans]|jgi:CNT family concentrative nucleoside transporter